MPAVKTNSTDELFRFFQLRLPGLRSESATKYRHTISDLECFMAGHRLSHLDLSDTIIEDWTADLLRRGLAKSTVVRHLNILNSLLKPASERHLTASTDAPRRLARLLAGQTGPQPALMTDAGLDSVLTTLRKALKETAHHDTVTDMLLLSLLNGALSIREITVLRKTDLERFDDISRRILERNIAPTRSYIFDLRQSYRTPAQVYTHIGETLSAQFPKASSSTPDPDMLAASVWAACAMRSGATASQTLRHLHVSAPYSIPSFCTPGPNEPDTEAELKARWDSAVATLLTRDIPQWYAMHIRRGVSYEDLHKEIAENVRPVPELFYPCETIRRKIGNATIFEDRPFISQTAFFRCDPENILPMFRIIGDKAWCYRLSNTPDSPYAAISRRDMQRFQSAVGIFSSDTELQSIGQLTPRPGETVIVIKAGYANRRGKVEEIINPDSPTAIIRVLLSTDSGYEWRIDLDPRQIEPLLAN